MGSIIAQTEASTFDDIDGLLLLSHPDTVIAGRAKAVLTIAVASRKEDPTMQLRSPDSDAVRRVGAR